MGTRGRALAATCAMRAVALKRRVAASIIEKG